MPKDIFFIKNLIRFMKKIALIVFIVLLGAFGIVDYVSNNSFVNNYFPNFISEIVGIAVVFFLIDRVVENDRKRERDKFKFIALKKFIRPVGEIADFFAKMIKASMDPKNEARPESYASLFSSALIFEIQQLDFGTDAPVVPKRNWFQWGRDVLENNTNKINDIINSYSPFLDAETLSRIEELEENHLIRCLNQLYLTPQIAREHGHSCPSQILGHPTMGEMINDSFAKITGLIKYLNDQLGKYGHSKMINFGEGFWMDTNSPKKGISRIQNQNPK